MLFWLLVVIFTRLANFLVVEIDKLDLDASGFTTCCVVEMTWVNMPDAYKNLRWTVPGHTDIFGCQQRRLAMFCGCWDHTFHVYQLCIRGSARAGTHDVVRSVNAALYVASKAIILEHNGVCRVENLYELNTILDTIIAHRRNVLQARATPPTRNGVRDVIDHVTI